MKHSIAVIGSADYQSVAEAIRVFSREADVSLFINAKHQRAYQPYIENTIISDIFTYKGFIGATNASLWWAISRLAPTEIIIVESALPTGNVLRSFYLWMFLFKKKPYVVKFRNKPEKSLQYCATTIYDSSLIFILFFMAQLGLVWIFGFSGLLFAAMLVAIEVALLVSKAADGAFPLPTPSDVMAELKTDKKENNRLTRPDLELGWDHLPPGDTWDFSIGNNHYEWTFTINSKGNRITSKPVERMAQKPRLSLYGCSYMFGFGVNDEASIPYLVQNKLEKYNVVNYGRVAYSANQIYKLMQRTIQRSDSAIAIAMLGDVHGIRSTCPLDVIHLPDYKRPTCVYKNGRLKSYPEFGYRKLLFSDKSALLKSVEYIYNYPRFIGRGRGDLQRNTLVYIINQMNILCQKNKVKFFVALLEPANGILHLKLSEMGVQCITLMNKIDNVKAYENFRAKWLLLPFDSHFNEKANTLFAEAVVNEIEQIENRSSKPATHQHLRKTSDNVGVEEAGNIYPLW